jgi:hypothetical protein
MDILRPNKHQETHRTLATLFAGDRSSLYLWLDKIIVNHCTLCYSLIWTVIICSLKLERELSRTVREHGSYLNRSHCALLICRVPC